MPLHLIKLAVGCESVKELKGWVAERIQAASGSRSRSFERLILSKASPDR